jgi:hypothetical protein
MLIIIIMFSSYMAAQAHAFMVGQSCARLLPKNAPVTRWSVFGVAGNIPAFLTASMLSLPFMPLMVIYQVTSPTYGKAQRAMLFAHAVKRGYIGYEEGHALWSSFEDEEAWWDAYFPR